ncbi:MAG: flagellin [Planctomycetota bacterium]
MSRINTNVQSLLAQRVLGQNNQNLGRSLERLSTGLRISRAKDDPAGLIASENLRSELTATNAAIGNAQRADQVVNIAEGGLQEISNLLTELQGLLTTNASSAGLSSAEKDANQLQIDSIIQTVDRISSSTSFQGIKLLNGNFDYQANNVNGAVDSFRINGAKFDGTSLDVDVVVTQSAQQGTLLLSLGGTDIDLNAGSQFVFEVAGTDGAREFSFASGTSRADIVAAINSFTDVTGVVASADAGTGIRVYAEDFGSSDFVSVKVVNNGGLSNGTNDTNGIYNYEGTDYNTADTTIAAAFDVGAATNGIRDEGQDVGASVNGITATSSGRTVRVNSDFLNVEIDLTTAGAQTPDGIQAFSISGGGASFMLDGNVDIQGEVSLGIADVATRKIGRFNDGSSTFFLDDLGSGKGLNLIDGDLNKAQEVVANALSEISSTRGRLGAFQRNTVAATINSLGIAVENTAAAESVIRDADFAAESANLTRNQILVSASTNTLALAGQQPQNVLQLLG